MMFMLWPLTFAVSGLRLCEEAADPVWGYGEGNPRCHFKSVDAYDLAILKKRMQHTVKNKGSPVPLKLCPSVC